MKKRGMKGIITVFLALISAVFLSLLFALVESVRNQGARVQCANVTDMGNMSVFGEYEKKLLEDYEVFGLDGACGGKKFKKKNIENKLKTYIGYSLTLPEDSIISFGFEPWQTGIAKCKITDYALLTDDGCENFYQQAAAYMRNTAATQLISKLMKYYSQSKEADKRQKEYESADQGSDDSMDNIESSEKQIRDQRESEAKKAAEERGEEVQPETESQETRKKKSLVKTIWDLHKKDLLTLVIPDQEISGKKISSSDLPPGLLADHGTFTPPRPYGGLADTLLFREYLLDRFDRFGADNHKDQKLDYQLEYILCGKLSDRGNLKKTAGKLLLLRAGCNYAFASADSTISGEAWSMAFAVVGWTGIEALTEGLKQLIILGWSYCESLVDLRTLFQGKKVPFTKDASNWVLKPENLGRVEEIIRDGGNGSDKGLSYKDHLRLLLYLQSRKKQQKRAVDLVQVNICAEEGLSGFRVNHLIVAIRDEVSYRISPVFSRVTTAFSGGKGPGSTKVKVKGGYAYLNGR